MTNPAGPNLLDWWLSRRRKQIAMQKRTREAELREQGYSKKEAQAIVSQEFSR